MEPNSNVESIAKKIATLILILGVISGLIMIIVGLANDDGLTVLLITGGVVDVISSVIFWVFVNLLVNISLKLDNRITSLAPHSIQAVAELLKEKSEKKPKEPVKEQVITPSIPKAEAPKYSEEAVAKLKESTEDEVENMVLGEILAGNISQARYILMTKKGLTMNQADANIEKIKSELK